MLTPLEMTWGGVSHYCDKTAVAFHKAALPNLCAAT